MWLILVGLGFPPAVLPFVLLVGAVLVDLAVTQGVRGWIAAPLVSGAVYGVAVGQEALGMLPPWNWWSVLPVAVVLALLWTGVDQLERSRWLERWKARDERAPDRLVAA
jgi:high-affinity Fe2+/Pb2+ permease